ncbi:hypothetical protein [Cognatiyoonia sp. IB215182]|uniref:hypothetical protein n=1 Tax=Cognatiyoonia sp. IB215182 TaxID=3097353 RepID=UPI002A153FF7|nr:hypothetical protein [Cognatiyoonia sp. IB215182]MDX8354249.1 hypothetical protein [Cognatiyoonia sp. IB215182]
MIEIPADDHGQIRVFATTDALPDAVRDKTPEGLIAIFGVPLDGTYVDIVKISDLGDMTLSAYITEGYDMKADAVDKAAVDQIRGTAVLVLSRATGGQAVTLKPGHGLRHVTTYSPVARITPLEALPDKSARDQVPTSPAKPQKSDARIGGMVAMYALLFMFALVGLMIWVGG